MSAVITSSAVYCTPSSKRGQGSAGSQVSHGRYRQYIFEVQLSRCKKANKLSKTKQDVSKTAASCRIAEQHESCNLAIAQRGRQIRWACSSCIRKRRKEGQGQPHLSETPPAESSILILVLAGRLAGAPSSVAHASAYKRTGQWQTQGWLTANSE